MSHVVNGGVARGGRVTVSRNVAKRRLAHVTD